MMAEKTHTLRLGIIGLGTVGCGVVNILTDTYSDFRGRLGENIRLDIVIGCARDLTKQRDCDCSTFELTDDPLTVANHPDVDIVVELMGGTTLAEEVAYATLKNGKQLVTANKALLAEKGNALFAVAKEASQWIGYEAAIAGGIPIVKALREGLVANNVNWLAGIINGTGNYILTEMAKPGADFDSVLKMAQDLGYAEADPTFDVEGIDAAHKLTLLGSMAFGIPCQFEQVVTQGISQITAKDIHYAKVLGYKIKHLGIAQRRDRGVELRVHPALVSNELLISHVDGVMNSVMVNADPVGTTLYYGPGAGAGATASAVVADIVDVVRHLASGGSAVAITPALSFADVNDVSVLPREQIETAAYCRIEVADHSGVLAELTQVLAQHRISIEQLHQDSNEADCSATIALITNVVTESVLDEAMVAINQLPDVQAPVNLIRVVQF